MAVAPRDLSTGRHLAQVGLQECPRESLERRPDRAGRGGVAGQEALLERAVTQEEIAGGDTERDQIPRPVEAIPEAPERGRVAARVESPHELRGRRPHRREHAFQLAAEEIDAPVGEARGEQTDDLAVAGIRIAEGEPDGVELDAGGVVELAIEALERLPQTLRCRHSSAWRHDNMRPSWRSASSGSAPSAGSSAGPSTRAFPASGSPAPPRATARRRSAF